MLGDDDDSDPLSQWCGITQANCKHSQTGKNLRSLT